MRLPMNTSLATLKPSGIRRINALAAQHPGCIALALGEPDFPTPDVISAEVTVSLNRGDTHYPPNNGRPALREALSAYMGDAGLTYSADEVILPDGATEALSATFMAMLNLGDVSVYATFGYLREILEAEGCKTVMLPGVTSFCAAAARLGQSLTGGMEQPLTIAPGRCAAEVLAAPGAKVLMKSGRQLPETLAALADAGLLSRSAMVCNCGLPNEEVWPDLADYDPARSAGYFATILVKEG